MMAQTVHDLPLFWCKAGCQVKIFEERRLHVDEVMSDACHWNKHVSAKQSHPIRLPVPCQNERYQPYCEKYQSDHFSS